MGKDVADILGQQNGSRDINRHVAKEDRLTKQWFLMGSEVGKREEGRMNSGTKKQ